MALFKILKGDSSRISLSTTPFHDGYAYFTPDDGGFYIDSEDNETKRRIRINPTSGGGSTSKNVILKASDWHNGRQTISLDILNANQNGIIGLAQDITGAQMTAAKDAELYIYEQTAGALTIAIGGVTPQSDIPVTIILFN